MSNANNYSKRTFNSPNPIRRYSHRRRLSYCLDILDLTGQEKVLDYGCGSGQFLENLHQSFPLLKLVGFEPVMKIKLSSAIKIYKDIELLAKDATMYGKFDVICCFEVFEHFNEAFQKKMVENMMRLLNEDGKVVVSVPIEVGPPALLKNMMRTRKFFNPKATEATIKNILRSTLFLPIEEYRKREGYLSHMGFDYRNLEKLFSSYFSFTSKSFSPFRRIGPLVNSQIFFVLKPLANKIPVAPKKDQPLINENQH